MVDHYFIVGRDVEVELFFFSKIQYEHIPSYSHFDDDDFWKMKIVIFQKSISFEHEIVIHIP